MEKITSAIEAQLKAIVGEGSYISAAEMKPDYTHDEKAMYGTGTPDAAVEVTSAEQIAQILKICNENQIPVTVRGAGTGLCGGSVAVEGGLLLVTAKMNQILALDEDNMTITVQPGVTLQEIMDTAAAHGLYYPPDPGEKTASIGGNVNTNAGGPAAAKYGTTRDYVLALTAVLPNGEIVKLGAPVLKSSNSLNLMQLIIGSEGNLAVVTEITLKLIPKKKYNISFICPYETVEGAMNAAKVFKKAGLDAANMELLTTDLINLAAEFTGEAVFPTDGDAAILVTYESDSEDALDMLMEQFAEISEETEPIDILVVDNPTMKASVWAAHAAFQTVMEASIKRFDESDVVLPMGNVADYIAAVRELAEELGLTVQVYGHAADGSLHIFVYGKDLSDEAFAAAAAAFMEKSYAKVTELQGVISGEHGIGYGKKAYLAAALGEAQVELMRAVKKAFDPNGILNPGKLV
ncbi:MAG: FAD-binding oxidoreductase [Oscillospiraceae bacterium]|nr:FAD-binding oxidoreductase [Oscillospiraceae bacterium]